MLLPTTREEMVLQNIDQLDIVLVTGDSYIDSPYIGTAVIGNVLLNAGYRVGVIAQPNIESPADITRLGEPNLFWGVTGGSVDSMVANYTALMKKRLSDDFTPGGINNRRPDRAVIAYSNLIRHWYKHTKPIVVGGIEASLRRIAHYDYWDDKIRASILLDAKADFLLYGMAEISILELASTLLSHEDPKHIRSLSYVISAKQSDMIPDSYLKLPSFEEVQVDPNAFISMFHTYYRNNDPITAKGLYQQHSNRIVVQNPPARLPTQTELDTFYSMHYTRTQHPYYERQGSVKALETIQFSIPTHRGCYGECNFCAITVHEGRTVCSRSQKSILEEAKSFIDHPDFKGIISDLGGPTANMYGIECLKKIESGSCSTKRCLTPEICPSIDIDHKLQISLLNQIRSIPGIKHVFIASGIRYDMVLADLETGHRYLEEIIAYHVSGQMKIAPEHSEEHVLNMMGKPSSPSLTKFVKLFRQLTQSVGKDQYLTFYLIAAHPACTAHDMIKLKRFFNQQIHHSPEQVQVFTPTPSTYSSVMYYTGLDPFTLTPIFVERKLSQKLRQKEILVAKSKFSITQTHRTKKFKVNNKMLPHGTRPRHKDKNNE